MRILVAGPESSGGNWITSLIAAHPDCPRIEHASYPAGNTIMPDYTGEDVTDVVLCLRDWSITRMSQKEHGYLDESRDNKELTTAEAISAAILREIEGRRLHCASYEGLCGPFWETVLKDLLEGLGLDVERYPWMSVRVKPANRKYLKA